MNCAYLKMGIVAALVFSFLASSAQNEAKISIVNKKQSGAFPLVSRARASSIYVDVNDATVVRIAAKALQEDIKLVTGKTSVLDSSEKLKALSIIVGTIGKNGLIDKLVSAGKLNVSKIKSQWERFSITVVDKPFANTEQALVIAGSDPRGTAFGIFELSKMIGVVPFYWWADITPQHQTEIYFTKGQIIANPPSVKYRGIFLNDEDWGLQPWAAKTFEPETGDIGPKTYAKIFELLLRLKANLIWPAMHPSTKAFYYYSGNPKVAADYSIVIGTSHAEPMLRNNVGEWNEKTMGHFNYISNRDTVYKYWEERVRQSKGNDAIYTMGMRGVHDSKMEGVKNEKEAAVLLERIIADQRGLLTQYIAGDATTVPQVFTAYKEVLDVYDAGLKLPDDITLVWPDDNYGYIQRLNNKEEKGRSGGSGVYYHASYWGRPHDYLWLSSTHPALVREEMMKAYETGAEIVWVLNVGDIKPLEYNIEQFLDMAYNAKPFKNSRYVKTHLTAWLKSIFGKEADKIEAVLSQYYNLAFQRKPEFMGWSQTEPTTKTNLTAFNHFYYGDEAQKRIDAYETLEKEVRSLWPKISSDRSDAFYQLVYYPVMGASWLNKKFLYRDKAILYAAQNRLSAAHYAQLSKAAYDSIVKETDYFNTKLAGGKWNGIMSFKPRELPAFKEPELPNIAVNSKEVWNLAPEGFVRADSFLMNASMTLPAFDDLHKQQYFIDLFLSDKKNVSWTAQLSHPWIKLSQSNGQLTPESGKAEARIWVSVDWVKMPASAQKGFIVFKGGGKEWKIELQTKKLKTASLTGYKGFVENNGFVVMHAANFSEQLNNKVLAWQPLSGLGYSGKALEAVAIKEGDSMSANPEFIKANHAVVQYSFCNFSTSPAEISIYTLPTHPLNNKHSMRYAVAVDDGPLQIVDFKTFGRSEEWKQNVLSNRAVRKTKWPALKSGKHTLKIYAVDPGVILDEIRIDLGGLKKAYSLLPETK